MKRHDAHAAFIQNILQIVGVIMLIFGFFFFKPKIHTIFTAINLSIIEGGYFSVEGIRFFLEGRVQTVDGHGGFPPCSLKVSEGLSDLQTYGYTVNRSAPRWTSGTGGALRSQSSSCTVCSWW
uniref:Uncharacterized protein n=1 Tax=Lepeophtheirus salmonis TaxID=72036 RepID=A0A0K2SYW2_LEPSM